MSCRKKTMNQIMKCRKLTFLSVTWAMVVSVHAASTWTGAAGNNDLATAGNWNGGLLTTTEGSITNSAGPLTLSSSLTMMRIDFNKSSGGDDIAVTLDLGVGKTWSLTDRSFVWPKATVTLKSGTLYQSAGRFFIGDNCSDATFVVDGPNAWLRGSETGSPKYIELGSANIAAVASKDNLLKVENGGKVSGQLQMGLLSKTDLWYCGTNTFWVTGQGSTFEGKGGTVIVGAAQGYAHFLLEDKASATISEKFVVGSTTGGRNLVKLTSGATMTVSDETHIGEKSSSNVLEVVSGSTATLSGKVLLGTTWDESTANGERPVGNVVRVSGTNSKLTTSKVVSVGDVAKSHDNAVEILDGGAISASTNLTLGPVVGSYGNRLLVDGGKLTMGTPANLYIGYAGENNSLCVTNGGVVNLGNYGLSVGDHGVSNVVEVAVGSTLNTGWRNFCLGWYNRTDGSKPGYNKLWVHGANAKFATDAFFRTDRFDGQIGNQVVIEDGGVLQCNKTFESPYTENAGGFSSNLQVRVTGDGSQLVVKGGQFMLGCNSQGGTTNVDATVTVADGGQVSVVTNNCFIGGGHTAAGTVCERNALHVGVDGTFAQWGNQKTFYIGNQTTARDNLVKVEGLFVYTNTGVKADNQVAIGRYGSANRMEIVNGGQAVMTKGGLTLGLEEAATDNKLSVGANSSLVVTNSGAVYVGLKGARSHAVIDGGYVNLYGVDRTVVGAASTAGGSSLELLDGAVVDTTQVIVGDNASNCSLVVSNATLNLVDHDSISYGGYLRAGLGTTAENTVVRIMGRAAKMTVKKVIVRRPTTRFEFVVPKEGFDETPFVCANGFEELAQGVTVHVSAEEGWPIGSKTTLMDLGDVGKLDNLTLTCDEGVRIRRVGTKIVAGKRGGMVMVVR